MTTLKNSIVLDLDRISIRHILGVLFINRILSFYKYTLKTDGIENITFSLQKRGEVDIVQFSRRKVEKEILEDLEFVNLNIVGLLLNFSGDAAGDDNTQSKNDSDSSTDSGRSSSIAGDIIFHGGQAAIGINGVLGVLLGLTSHSFTTTIVHLQATGIRNILASSSERRIFPVSISLNSAAFEFMLNNVPGLGDAVMLILSKLLHTLRHAISDNLLDVILVDVDGNSNSDQRQEDQGQERSKRVEHAMVLGASSATSKESDDEHSNSNDDQDHRGIEVGVAKKAQVLGHVDLDVGSDSNDGNGSQEEDEIA